MHDDLAYFRATGRFPELLYRRDADGELVVVTEEDGWLEWPPATPTEEDRRADA